MSMSAYGAGFYEHQELQGRCLERGNHVHQRLAHVSSAKAGCERLGGKGLAAMIKALAGTMNAMISGITIYFCRIMYIMRSSHRKKWALCGFVLDWR